MAIFYNRMRKIQTPIIVSIKVHKVLVGRFCSNCVVVKTLNTVMPTNHLFWRKQMEVRKGDRLSTLYDLAIGVKCKCCFLKQVIVIICQLIAKLRRYNTLNQFQTWHRFDKDKHCSTIISNNKYSKVSGSFLPKYTGLRVCQSIR